jgi:UDP-glucose 4-epimerase
MDSYGRSKAEAETALTKVASRSNLELVILRLPLVYGPGMKANMARLFKAVQLGVPLPLGGIENSRSILYLGNLVHCLALCLEHPRAVGKVFHVADSKPLSTPDLAALIASCTRKPSRLFRLPIPLLKAFSVLLGRSSDLDRLTGSLVLDCGRIRSELGWKPPFSVEEGLRETGRWFVGECR